MLAPIDGVVTDGRTGFVDGCNTPGCEAWSQVKGFTHTRTRKTAANPIYWKGNVMKLNRIIQQVGATGYILLWLLGIPIPILLLIFLLRGCT